MKSQHYPVGFGFNSYIWTLLHLFECHWQFTRAIFMLRTFCKLFTKMWHSCFILDDTACGFLVGYACLLQWTGAVGNSADLYRRCVLCTVCYLCHIQVSIFQRPQRLLVLVRIIYAAHVTALCANSCGFVSNPRKCRAFCNKLGTGGGGGGRIIARRRSIM